MKRDLLLKMNRDAIVEIAKRHGAQSVRVFGSHARGASQEGSDLDLLVTLESGRTLLDLVAIKQDIEDLLECKVDIATEASLSPYIRERILGEAVAL